jgi:hypothetical protein
MKYPKYMLLAFGLVALLPYQAAWADTFDYDYSCTRFLDPFNGDPVTVYANDYQTGTGTSGNALYEDALPVYVGLNPDTSKPIYVEPGYSVAIIDIPGKGPVAGKPRPIPAGRPGAAPPGPPIGTPPGAFWGMGTNKKNGILTLQSPPNGTTVQFTGAWCVIGGTTYYGHYSGSANVGDTFAYGCVHFGTLADWTGCDVSLEPLANGDFSSMYAILGGGSYWPNSSVPSFYANKTWDLVYIGDSTNAFDGSGLGQVDVQCDLGEFMSVATPEGYAGCVTPETSSTFALLGLCTITLLACDWRRRMAKA